MKPDDIRALLERVAQSKTTVSEAFAQLASLPYEDLGFALVDHHRALRTGYPEFIFSPGKTAEEIAAIATSIYLRGQTALATRIEDEKAKLVLSEVSAEMRAVARHEPVPRFLIFGPDAEKRGRGSIAVAAAGTADRPVAEEAARTAEILGNEVVRIIDVGVAGLHRLLAQRETLQRAEVVIVVAGMEGALPSVVSGLISRPIIAVPTSIGIGASFGGLAALLSMLNACAPGITVVNIDNGFSAGYAASVINAPRSEP
jgi:NCAIR mutase (PurE)-related protein